MTLTSYKKAIASLLKAYHKKWDWAGKPITKKKRSKKTNRKISRLSRTC
jgi:hypothetical protein